MYDKETASSDRELTLRNRKKLFQNKNLLYWYQKLFEFKFLGIDNIFEKKILEVGSGTSPLKVFYDNVLTSDILDLDYLDIVCDCHNIDQCKKIKRESLDIIVSTNVLHHLKEPLKYLSNAANLLKKGGFVIITEPYFSVISKVIYEKIHHEYLSFNIKEPIISKIEGPLKSANIALPFLIFFGHRGWADSLKAIYKFDEASINYFSAFSYFITGGISRKINIPPKLYKNYFKLDLKIAKFLPDIFSSFFMLRLEKR
jgi:SAM-dependent methyltransferase